MKISNKILFFLIVFPFFVLSQNKDQLKQQKKAIEKEISYTTSLLNKTKENKETSLQYIGCLLYTSDAADE